MAEERIAQAEAHGVVLSERDKQAIRESLTQAERLNAQARRLSVSSSDPMGKGNAFPMGVGFVRMTRRKERAIDASVRKAGVAVGLWNRAKQAQERAESLLAGKGTEQDRAEKAARAKTAAMDNLRMLMNAKRGDRVAGFAFQRLYRDRDGYPSSFTFAGEGIIRGVNDKIEIARAFFGGSKTALKQAVDEVRAEARATALPGCEHIEVLPEASLAFRD